jgi:hypothetical protein
VAVAEALFSVAEFERKRNPVVAMPRFPRNTESVDEYREKLGRFMTSNAARVLELRKAYGKVAELQPMPPAQWLIAATSRIGDLWAEQVEHVFIAAPSDVVADPEFVATRERLVQRGAAQCLIMARDAFERCIAYSVKYLHSNPWTRHCEEWLVRHFPEEYQPTVDFLFVPKWRAPEPLQGWGPRPVPRHSRK